MRVILTALALCALAFALNVIGDLSVAQPRVGGARVQIALPPVEPLIATDGAEAREIARPLARRSARLDTIGRRAPRAAAASAPEAAAKPEPPAEIKAHWARAAAAGRVPETDKPALVSGGKP